MEREKGVLIVIFSSIMSKEQMVVVSLFPNLRVRARHPNCKMERDRWIDRQRERERGGGGDRTHIMDIKPYKIVCKMI